MTRHLLVTNDFPPKVGGIQQYLWELWRRLDPNTFEVHCTPYEGAEEFDADQDFTVHRSREPVLIPYPWLPGRIDTAARSFGADLVVIDPAVPLGLIGPALSVPYVVVLHGAEVAVPGRLPGSKQAIVRVLEGATGVISAGQYALDEAERAVGHALRSVVIPPGVDVARFRPFESDARSQARRNFGVGDDDLFVVSLSRLVPRKGMDTLIAAAGRLGRRYPGLQVAIAGSGRDRRRLQRRIDAVGAPVRLLGRIDESEKPDLYASADVFAMMCRTRWAGLEQEGFGIVFVEAAAAGVPQIARSSGGAAEAVEHGVTGIVMPADATVDDAAVALDTLLADPGRRHSMGRAARTRAIEEFSYDRLADRLAATLEDWAT